MGRPIKWRRVSQMPEVLEFQPVGAADPAMLVNVLLIEELEAVRLKDLEGLEQEACADQMQVSRPTFQRILMNARQKIADSLVHGKGIRIEGGTFTRNVCAPDFEPGNPRRQGQGAGCRRNCWRKALNEQLSQEESEVQDHAANHSSDR